MAKKHAKSKPPFLPREDALEAMRAVVEINESFLSMIVLEEMIVFRMAPRPEFVPWSGRAGPAMKLMTEFTEKGENSANTLMHIIVKTMADDALREGRYADAIKYYRRAVEDGPHPYDRDCYSNMCLALIKAGRYEHSLEAGALAILCHTEIHGSIHDDWYIKTDYRTGLALKNLGCYERALFPLERASYKAPENAQVSALLDEVKAKLRQNEEKYGDDKDEGRRELEDRLREHRNYGLDREDIEMLFEAGIMPWDIGVQDAVRAGRGMFDPIVGFLDDPDFEEQELSEDLAAELEQVKIEASKRDTPWRHSMLQCQGCFKSKADDVKLLKCLRCGIATYCSKTCQKDHWKYHKQQCDFNANAAEDSMSSESCIHQLRSWTARHRPTLTEYLLTGLGAQKDKKAHEHRTLVYILEYRPEAKRTAQKFKVLIIEAMEISKLIKISPIFAGIQKQLDWRTQEMKDNGMGTDYLTVYVEISMHNGRVDFNVVPVGFYEDQMDGPPASREKTIRLLNEGIIQ